MKYRIWEKTLNEYTNSPAARLVEEIEADSFEDAYNIAKMKNPNLFAIRIDDMMSGGHTAIEYD